MPGSMGFCGLNPVMDINYLEYYRHSSVKSFPSLLKLQLVKMMTPKYFLFEHRYLYILDIFLSKLFEIRDLGS